MNKVWLKRALVAIGSGVAAGSAMAVGTVPADVQTAITAASTSGVDLTTAIAVGLAAFVLLAKAFGKFGLR